MDDGMRNVDWGGIWFFMRIILVSIFIGLLGSFIGMSIVFFSYRLLGHPL